MKKRNYNKEDIPKLHNIGEKLDEFVERIKDNFSESKILFVKVILKGGNKKDVISSFLKETAGEKNNFDENEYRGIYIFAEKLNDGTFKYLYTGISRKAIQRINDHVSASDKGSATWAYLMVKHDGKIKEIGDYHHKKKPEEVIKKLKKLIPEAIRTKQENIISKLYIGFIPLGKDNYFLHMAEPYVAAKLECKWNSFKTH